MKKNSPGIAISILVGAVLVAGAVWYSGAFSPSRGPATDRGQGNSSATPSVDNEPFIGSPNAPLTLFYWHDFQCPFCKRFDTETLPALVSEYVDTGKLRVVFKDFVFLGPDSQTAAIASRAVWDAASSSYGAWQEAIYEHQGGENSGWASRANLIALTRTVPGIDTDKVSSLMGQNANAYQTAVSADYTEGQKFGIGATPGFMLGGQTFSGAQPLSFFEQIINAELAKQ